MNVYGERNCAKGGGALLMCSRLDETDSPAESPDVLEGLKEDKTNSRKTSCKIFPNVLTMCSTTSSGSHNGSEQA